MLTVAPWWWFSCKPKHVGAASLNLKCFNNSTFFNVVCVTWKIKCWIFIDARCNHEVYLSSNLHHFLTEPLKNLVNQVPCTECTLTELVGYFLTWMYSSIQVFWDVTQCHWTSGFRRLENEKEIPSFLRIRQSKEITTFKMEAS